MIKGHSGSGPRTNEEHPPVLVLVDGLQNSPSSPPTPTLSATSSEGQRPPHNGMNTSFERAPPTHYQTMPPPEQQHYGQSMYTPTFILFRLRGSELSQTGSLPSRSWVPTTPP